MIAHSAPGRFAYPSTSSPSLSVPRSSRNRYPNKSNTSTRGISAFHLAPTSKVAPSSALYVVVEHGDSSLSSISRSISSSMVSFTTLVQFFLFSMKIQTLSAHIMQPKRHSSPSSKPIPPLFGIPFLFRLPLHVFGFLSPHHCGLHEALPETP